MSEQSFDFAVFGATPFAALLALALKETQGKRVVLCGRRRDELQLTRGMDLSLGVMTRPQSWQLLAQTAPEAQRLLAKSGGDVFTYTDVTFMARSFAGKEAAAHLRHMMAGFGHPTEALAGLADGIEGFVARRVTRVVRRRFYARLPARLKAADIPHIWDNPKVQLTRQGGARIEWAEGVCEAATAIFADDAAALQHLGAAALEKLARPVRRTAILSEPDAQLLAPAVVDVDGGGIAYSHPNGAAECTVLGDSGHAASWFAAHLVPGSQTRLAGQTRFSGLLSHDGAPIVGRASAGSGMLAVNFGLAGVFFIPALARFLCGEADAQETAFFGEPWNRTGRGKSIAEPRPQLELPA